MDYSRDFSSILSFEDRIGGNPETVDEMVDFWNCVAGKEIQEARYIGCDLTLSNRKIFSKVDRIVVNDDCISAYPELY